MSEQDYIDATNLAKLRIMRDICRDILCMRPEEEAIQLELRRRIRAWIETLEPIVAAPRSPG